MSSYGFVQDNSPRFSISRQQRVLLFVLLVNLVALGISSRDASQSALAQSQILGAAENPATSIISTQRETLVYSTRLAQWSSGSIPRRTVQIARAALAQRLQVIDSTGKSVGATSSPGFMEAIKASDTIVESTSPGLLQGGEQIRVKAALLPVMDSLVFQARGLVTFYQAAVDNEIKRVAQSNRNKDARTLRLLALFVLLFIIFLMWNGWSNIKNYRRTRAILEKERTNLRILFRELKDAQVTVQELKSLNEQKNAFISTVNHELRTPMTSIIGYTEVLKRIIAESEKDDAKKYLQVISRNADIMLNLVESMLSISRLESQSELDGAEKVNIDEVVSDSIFLLQPTLEKSDISVEVESIGREHFIYGNASQISQVVINLLANAIKFSPPSSSIQIRLAQYGDGPDGSEITIIDHGIGIPASDQERIFQRFFRAKNAVKNQFAGTGLGLSIVNKVIELHHGSITVCSEEGVGTTFTVRIPVNATATKSESQPTLQS